MKKLNLTLLCLVVTILSFSNAYAADNFLADPNTFLDSLNGKYEVGLFSGSLNYTYPINVPKGRNKMTPTLNLLYSNIDHRYSSELGYGWSLPINGIYRTPIRGTNTIYTSDLYTADIFGNSEELIVVDSANGIYAPKNEGSFNKYVFDGTDWTAVDKAGTVYTFGTTTATREDDPDDSSRVYKWMLEKIEDTNGNFITFTYNKSSGAIYPNTIRYTGYDTEQGLFEIKFNYQTRSDFISYRTGFKVTYNKLVDSIDLKSYASGSAVTVMTYDLTYTEINDAVSLLDSVTVRAGNESLPPTEFEYFDGSESVEVKKINSLYKITEPFGGTHTFTYKPASAYRGTSGETTNWLPFIVYTVYEDKMQAGPNDPVYTTTYDYQNGHYFYDDLDAYKREYAGFGKVTATDPDGNVHKYYFHQSQNDPNNADDDDIGEYQDHISKKGHIYREEQYDDNNHLLKAIINKWDMATLSDDDPDRDRFQVFLARTTTVDYGENAQSKAKATTYDYDSYGNVDEQIDYGEVTLTNQNGDFTDTGTDKITTTTEYAYDTTDHLLNYPKLIEREDQSSNLVSRQKLYYDELSYGQIDKGNRTKQEDYRDASNYNTTEWAVNSRGMVTTTTNPRAYDTDITYDTHNLYPATITNAKSQETDYTYDPFFGVVTETTDPNGFTKQTILDDFGRIETQKLENNSSTMATVRTIAYDLSSSPVSITETLFPNNTDTNSNAIAITKKTYFDGFKRPIQIKKEAEGANNYIVTSLVYDGVGNVAEEYLPKTASGLSYQAITTSDPKTAYTYDALKRVKTAVNSEGTTTSTYNDWSVNVVDADGKQKNYLYDARNNLAEVQEYLNSTPHSTFYTYDSNNNLIKIEDADGNEQEMTYDFLGKKLTEELLHAPGESTPNSYSYTYDDSGNKTSQTDAESQTINYTYDELDRPLTENTSEVTYTYDTATNGIGRLASVTSSGGTKSYAYDLRGYTTGERKVINSVTYDTAFTYDLLGNILSITYPDSAPTTVTYSYNNAGQIEAIPDYVTDFDYSPIDTVSFIEYANGITTTNTYDPAHLYRLTHKVTTNGTEDLQNISYTFDPVGNITAISDTSDTNAAKDAAYVYDDLHRLTSATITNTANSADYTHTFTYGITGNITSKSDVGSYTYANIHPQAVTSDGTNTYTYDNNGSLTGDGTWTHSYDTRNRLIESTNGTDTITYTYDEGRTRLTKSDGTTTTTYVNDYFEKEGSTEKLHILANKLKIATIDGETTVFHHTDHLTGNSVETDSNGDVIELIDYYPYGSSRLDEKAGSYQNNYKFTGKELDEETGFYYYGARYYNPVLGRFISLDPLILEDAFIANTRPTYSQQFSASEFSTNSNNNQDQLQFMNKRSQKDMFTIEAKYLTDPQLQNAFSYAKNDPLIYTDPTGKSVIHFDFTTNVGLGGAAGNTWSIGFASDGSYGLSVGWHAGGLGGGDASIGIGLGFSNEETWSDTEGPGTYAGIGAKLGVGIDTSVNISPDGFNGIDIGTGVGPSTPIYLSGGVSDNKVIISRNIKEDVQYIKQEVTEAANATVSAIKDAGNKVIDIINKL